MARYIDADQLAEYITTNYCINCDIYDGEKCNSCLMNDALNFIETFQSADVVPKSEVERLEAELAEWHNLTQKSVSGYIRYCEREAVKNFTEEFEEDCLDFPMKETDIHLIVDNEKYAELKKKYTEG